VQLKFIRCYSCGTLVEMNKLNREQRISCYCGGRHFIPTNPSKLKQLMFVILRPFYWPHLFGGNNDR
jgi:DNA-directed RNA polymerase subunit RPC12/RpoP